MEGVIAAAMGLALLSLLGLLRLTGPWA